MKHKKNESDNYGQAIREIRIKSDLSQAEVAEALGVTPGFISNVENNRTGMSLRMLVYFAQLTGHTLDSIAGQLEKSYRTSSLDNEIFDKVSSLTNEQKKKLIQIIDIIF